MRQSYMAKEQNDKTKVALFLFIKYSFAFMNQGQFTFDLSLKNI